MNKVHIIAEAGTNHGGNLETAKRLVKIAYNSGADSVKFQIIYPEGLYLPEFFADGKYTSNEVFSIRQGMMLSDQQWHLLKEYCQDIQIPASASVFDTRGLTMLDSWNPPYIKIASCDLNFSDLLKEAASCGKRVILSTGMATQSEIERAVKVFESTGNKDLVIMHCVSSYPCPLGEMNLAMIPKLKEFGYKVGLSDHTESSIASAIAVGMGVQFIEKHFTYDRSARGFDHSYAMDPAGLNQFVNDIREVEKSLTPRTEKLSHSEKQVATRARRSLYAARDILPGETIQKSDILTVRPQAHLEPDDLLSLIGVSSHLTIKKFQPIPKDLLN